MKTTGHGNGLPKLFSPIRIGNMTVKNRLAMAPIGRLFSSLDGAVRREFKDFIIARAQGGVGMIMLADAGFRFTSLEATVGPALLKGMMKAARELVGAVHDHGARIGAQLHKLGVTIRLGNKATAKTVQKDSPDVVLIATGAVPSKPEIPGVERRNVATAWDVLGGKVHVGEQVVVIGGNALGLETADFLATQGRNVDVVEMLEHVGRDLGPTVRWHEGYDPVPGKGEDLALG